MCPTDNTLTLGVSQYLATPLRIETIDTWEHLLKTQGERKRKLEILAGMQEVKINVATEATHASKLSFKVLTDHIDEAIRKKLHKQLQKLPGQHEKPTFWCPQSGPILISCRRKFASGTQMESSNKIQEDASNDGKRIKKGKVIKHKGRAKRVCRKIRNKISSSPNSQPTIIE